jgi:hypothetical protein
MIAWSRSVSATPSRAQRTDAPCSPLPSVIPTWPSSTPFRAPCTPAPGAARRRASSTRPRHCSDCSLHGHVRVKGASALPDDVICCRVSHCIWKFHYVLLIFFLCTWRKNGEQTRVDIRLARSGPRHWTSARALAPNEAFQFRVRDLRRSPATAFADLASARSEPPSIELLRTFHSTAGVGADRTRQTPRPLSSARHGRIHCRTITYFPFCRYKQDSAYSLPSVGSARLAVLHVGRLNLFIWWRVWPALAPLFLSSSRRRPRTQA